MFSRSMLYIINCHDMYFDQIHRGCCAREVFVEVKVESTRREMKRGSDPKLETNPRASGFTSDVTTLGGGHATSRYLVCKTFLGKYITGICESGL